MEGKLAAPRLQLADCRADFAALLAWFGENPAAAPRDTEFWQDTLAAFVRALADAQHSVIRQRQVCVTTKCLGVAISQGCHATAAAALQRCARARTRWRAGLP